MQECVGRKVWGHILDRGVPIREERVSSKKAGGFRKLDTHPRKVENGGKIRLEKRFSV